MRVKMIFALVSTAIQLQAGWIVWTNTNPGVTATGAFPTGSGPSGTVIANVSIVSDGLNNGVLGIEGRVYGNALLTPTFTANYPTNPDGSFTNLATSYNDSQDAYTILLDFSGLLNGVLPSGSLVTILDLDILENYRNVTATDVNGNQIATPWLAAMTGQAALLDWYAVGGDSTGSVTAATTSNTLGVYQFLGQTANDDSALLGFRTTQDIRSLSILFNKSNNLNADAGTGGSLLAIGSPVPEPGTMSMFAVASLAGLALLRKRKS